jgi:hypothetical protein
VALPGPALKAAAELGKRILPGAAAESDPAEGIVKGLRVMQLVGAHTREDT